MNSHRRPGTLRLDELLVLRGLAPTRSQARALILAGRVHSAGRRLDKAGTRVSEDEPVELQPGERWVGRGGHKLAGALRDLSVDVQGRDVLDVGASTGGFTQVLLEAGAARVIALDVGRGQLDWGLRNDPRVHPLEGLNARHLTADRLPFAPSLATLDVSFISLRLVLPAVSGCLAEPGDLVALVKPQFEVGRGQVGRGGIVRDPELHRRVLDSSAADAAALGLALCGACASPLRGADGNREFFLWLRPGAQGLEPQERDARFAALVDPDSAA